MVKLSEPINYTLDAIYGVYSERAAKTWDSYGLSVGVVGHECTRYLWYTLRWAYPPENVGPIRQRRFDTGNIEEERLLNDLEAAGFVVERVDPTTGSQFRVELVSGWLRGKLDGTVAGLPEAPVTTHIVECKSHNDKSFKELKKTKKIEVCRQEHYAQAQIYMHGSGRKRCLYLAVNKNDDELYTERVNYDAAFCEKIERKVSRLLDTVKAPGRISENPKLPPCCWCNALDVCQHGVIARNHCRTCVAFEFRASGVGYCTHFGRELNYEEQQRGCDQHLYLPDFVPGEQIDADVAGRTVTYKMADGSTWVDGVVKTDNNEKEKEATTMKIVEGGGGAGGVLHLAPDMIQFVQSGDVQFRIRSNKSQNAYTYHVKESLDGKKFFVALVDGNGAAAYMGNIISGEFARNDRSKVAASAPGFVAFEWFWKRVTDVERSPVEPFTAVEFVPLTMLERSAKSA